MLLLPDLPSHCAHLRALPKPMYYGELVLSTRRALLHSTAINLLQFALVPSCSCRQVSQDTFVALRLLRYGLPDCSAVQGFRVLCVASASLGLLVASSLCDRLDDGSHILPEYAGQVLRCFVCLLEC